MTFRPAAAIGMPLDEVDTPCLILELDAFERNLARLPESLRGKSIRLRPHAKSHKCPEIALRQIALGAVGVLQLKGATRFKVGDKLKLIPGHCDPTVNLYDWYVCIRDGRVEALWPITARGAVL